MASRESERRARGIRAGCGAIARALIVAAPLLALCLPGAASAQLSPGPLSEPHAELEGSGSCLECHSSGRGVDPDRCLSCHTPLAQRIAAGRGLHARPQYSDCKTCHIEHHGREFELVWWGDAGRDAFDHELTRFSLVGRHRELGCRECHRAERIEAPQALRAHGKDLDRTFLGLGTDCLSCHRDEHRGQFAGAACLSCHDQSAWSPAASFDHDEARFALTGRHRQVECERCHRTVEQPVGDDPDFRRFRGLAFEACSDCHEDPHTGRFGADCQSCHATSDWRRVDERGFDHDLTRYRLEGRHRAVACESCHRPGRPRRGLAFDACTDCHRDEHAGQLAGRPDGGRCESCHTVDGFVPALYTRADHEAIFVLEGAHERLECDACHRREPAAELVRLGAISPAAAAGADAILQLRMAASTCTDCHRDPHDGSAREVAPSGCENCHGVERWQEVAFDHGLTDFALSGPHSRLSCRQCHAAEGARESADLDFGDLGGDLEAECAACHFDPHREQFADGDGRTSCLRCHESERWQPPTHFDHGRDARFSLEGAHGRVECVACHAEVGDEIGVWVRYRPLGRRCIDCHGGG